MTKHEQTIREHCARHGIRIRVLPSGAVRFNGYGVDLITADIANVTTANLETYEPQKGYALRNV